VLEAEGEGEALLGQQPLVGGLEGLLVVEAQRPEPQAGYSPSR
jgi:hypothetical protein